MVSLSKGCPAWTMTDGASECLGGQTWENMFPSGFMQSGHPGETLSSEESGLNVCVVLSPGTWGLTSL